MNKKTKYLPLLGVAALAAVISSYVVNPSDKHNPALIQRGAPGRLLETGPYGTDVSTSEQIGGSTFNLKAKRLYFKKTKTFGFDNALFKKLVADDLNITIFKDEKKIFALYKDYQEMNPDMKCIVIRNPVILYPKMIKQTDRARIDKIDRTITLYQQRGHILKIKF